MNNNRFDSMVQGELRRQLDEQLLVVHDQASKAHLAKDKSEDAVNELHQLETTQLTINKGSRVMGFFVHQNTGWWILLLGIVAAYLLDYFLFRPTVEYIVWRFFNIDITNSSWQLRLVQLVVPAIIIALELNIASQMYLNKEDGSRAAYWMYFLIGVISVIVMPCLVAATFLAGQPSWTMVFQLQLIGLVILSALAHIIVLFGGKHSHDAKVYISYKLRSYWLRRRINRTGTAFRHELHRMSRAYIVYMRTLDTFNATYRDSPLVPGPFRNLTQELISEQFSENGFHRLRALGEGGETNSG